MQLACRPREPISCLCRIGDILRNNLDNLIQFAHEQILSTGLALPVLSIIFFSRLYTSGRIVPYICQTELLRRFFSNTVVLSMV